VAPDFACRRLGSARQQVDRFREVLGDEFVVLIAARDDPEGATHAAVGATRLAWPAPVRVVAVGPDRALRGIYVLAADDDARLAPYTASGGRAWLIRPDGHLVGSRPLSSAGLDDMPQLMARAIGVRAG
jgi:hypothetical protein